MNTITDNIKRSQSKEVLDSLSISDIEYITVHHYKKILADLELLFHEFLGKQVEAFERHNKLRELLNMSVNEIELSVRAYNCLINAYITTVSELVTKSEQEILNFRNVGKKVLNEIKAKLDKLGLSLGMVIDERLLDNWYLRLAETQSPKGLDVRSDS